MFARSLDVDIWSAIDAAATKPYGFMRFTPGPGVGGHCLPVDPAYLAWRVERQIGQRFRFVELANEVNRGMPDYVVARVVSMLNDEQRSVNGARILLLGLAYKAGTSDWREAPVDDDRRPSARARCRRARARPARARGRAARPADRAGRPAPSRSSKPPISWCCASTTPSCPTTTSSTTPASCSTPAAACAASASAASRSNSARRVELRRVSRALAARRERDEPGEGRAARPG